MQRSKVFRSGMCVLAVCLIAWLPVARAQETAYANAAWLRGDFAQACQLARASIESGTHTAAELVSLYRILGLASARQGDLESARLAFTTALALDPNFRLRDAAPEVRSPYMEARGFWSEHPTPLAVTLSVTDARNALLLAITDPADLSVRVLLRVRGNEREPFLEVVQPRASELSIRFDSSQAQQLEYSVALLDQFGNRLWQAGSEQQPLLLNLKPPHASDVLERPALPTVRAESADGAPATRPRRYLVAGSMLLVLGAGSLTGAVLAHLKREQLANDWNHFRCHGDGSTRGMVCANERERISMQEKLAAGLYGLGGATLVAGVLLIALGPARSKAPDRISVRCTGGPGELGAQCSLAF